MILLIIIIIVVALYITKGIYWDITTTHTPQVPPYKEYIKSDAWFERRDIYFFTHEKNCVACESAEHIDLHHMTYDRLGSERDEDLIPLCKVCHDQYHTIYKRASVVDSKNFVSAKQAARKGKEIYMRNQDLIAKVENEQLKQSHTALLQFREEARRLNYDRLTDTRKQDLRFDFSSAVYKHNAIPFLAVAEIIKRDHHDEVYQEGFHPEGANVRKNIYSISDRLEYRWVQEEIRSRLPLESQPYTEIEKLKAILLQDDGSTLHRSHGYKPEYTSNP
ncbi:MAG: hypothetical protein EXS69_02080 [Candidatus Zambryskibacteria bacterium]|nr:hypothetical protein [Candidatus Zambryskibacteria bacterium]